MKPSLSKENEASLNETIQSMILSYDLSGFFKQFSLQENADSLLAYFQAVFARQEATFNSEIRFQYSTLGRIIRHIPRQVNQQMLNELKSWTDQYHRLIADPNNSLADKQDKLSCDLFSRYFDKIFAVKAPIEDQALLFFLLIQNGELPQLPFKIIQDAQGILAAFVSDYGWIVKGPAQGDYSNYMSMSYNVADHSFEIHIKNFPFEFMNPMDPTQKSLVQFSARFVIDQQNQCKQLKAYELKVDPACIYHDQLSVGFKAVECRLNSKQETHRIQEVLSELGSERFGGLDRPCEKVTQQLSNLFEYFEDILPSLKTIENRTVHLKVMALIDQMGLALDRVARQDEKYQMQFELNKILLRTQIDYLQCVISMIKENLPACNISDEQLEAFEIMLDAADKMYKQANEISSDKETDHLLQVFSQNLADVNTELLDVVMHRAVPKQKAAVNAQNHQAQRMKFDKNAFIQNKFEDLSATLSDLSDERGRLQMARESLRAGHLMDTITITTSLVSGFIATLFSRAKKIQATEQKSQRQKELDNKIVNNQVESNVCVNKAMFFSSCEEIENTTRNSIAEAMPGAAH